MAAEEQQERPPEPRQTDAPPLFSDTMTASPLLLGASTATATDRGIGSGGGGESSGPALDFLALSKDEERAQEPQQDSNENVDDDDSGEDIARLMALLGLLPPPWDGDDGRDSGGCDCSGGDGFLAKIVGVVGPKCEKEKRRVEGWIEHYCGDGGGGCREPARLAHLLLAKASWSWDGEGPGDGAAIAFPSTVKEFLDRDAPPRLTGEEQSEAE